MAQPKKTVLFFAVILHLQRIITHYFLSMPLTDSFKNLIQTEITKYTDRLPKTPSNLYDPIAYMLSLKAKRLRPLFALFGYSLFGKKDYDKVLPFATALEVFHNFSLIHDDIMDCSKLRRGQPTVVEKWGTATAILAGDVMLVHALELINKNYNQLPQVSERFANMSVRVCEGQQWDMEFESQTYISQEQYYEMIGAKTAAIFATSLEGGAYIAGATPQQANVCYQLGMAMGLQFQLIDDFLDFYGEADFGKVQGQDIVQNKKTILFIKAQQQAANSEQQKRLEKLLSIPEARSPEKIATAQLLFIELNVETQIQDLIQAQAQKINQLFKELPESNEATLELQQFISSLSRRNI